jgi:hypothetical protein
MPFYNHTSSLTDATETTVGTVGTGKVWVVIGCNAANTGTAQNNITIKVASKHVVKAAPVPASSALSVLDGKIIAEAGETITATSSNSSGEFDIIVSVLEQDQ